MPMMPRPIRSLDHVAMHGFDVVDQDAAADHPAPRLIGADIGDLLHPFRRFRGVEVIIDVLPPALAAAMKSWM